KVSAASHPGEASWRHCGWDCGWDWTPGASPTFSSLP
ncbi:hypothetical protein AK812_SmicGene48417, partial [Symbiodinium microadriaticum]